MNEASGRVRSSMGACTVVVPAFFSSAPNKCVPENGEKQLGGAFNLKRHGNTVGHRESRLDWRTPSCPGKWLTNLLIPVCVNFAAQIPRGC